MRHESLPETPLAYRLLEVLGKIPGSFLGAGELCERLVADREMLKEAVGALQRLGYHLEDHPAHGLSLRMEVDVLVQEEVEARLKTRALGRLLACHLEVGSTNDLATRAAQAGTAHGTVITAEHQTSGRGRLGRAWFSPPGCGLWFSVVLRPNLMLEQAWIVTLGAAVAAADAVQAVTGL
ncbi:MAG: hypothetical protein O2954_14405, partial [bacterium]|nr:hypothetical protein [bacterium]